MTEQSIAQIVAGSWREAWNASGLLERAFLLGLVWMLTAFMPVLFVLALLETFVVVPLSVAAAALLAWSIPLAIYSIGAPVGGESE